MASRVYYYAQALARTSTTTTDYSQVKISLPFTPNASKTYALIWSAILDSGTSWKSSKVRLQNVSTSVTLAENIVDIREAADSKNAFGGVALYTAGVSPSEQTIELQVASSTGVTTGIQEATLLILELIDSVDIWVSSVGTSTRTTTYGAKATLSWTAASAGDYFTFMCAEVQCGSPDIGIRLNIDAGTIASSWPEMANSAKSSDWQPYFGAYRHQNISGSHSAVLEWASLNGVSAPIRNAYGIAFRLDQYDASFWAEDRTEHSSTSATYVDSASVTGTPAAVAHAIIACGRTSIATDGTSTTRTGNRIAVGGTGIGTVFCQQSGFESVYRGWMQSLLRVEAETSTTWSTQYARSSGSTAARSDEHVLAVLQLVSSIAPTQQLAPDAIAASTNLIGAVTAIDEDPDAPDANWLTATSATAAINLRVTFPTPGIAPEGQQYFRYYVRKTAGATNPTINAELLQGNSLRLVLSRNVPVTSTTGQLFENLWHDTDLVTTLDGSDVELRLYSTVGFTDFQVGSTSVYSSTGPLLVSSAFLTSNEVTYPATIAAGDLLLCQVVTRNLYMDSGSTMIGTGWTAFAGNTYGDNTTRVHQSLYWRIADGTEGGGTIIVRTFGNNQESMVLAAIHRFTSNNGFAGTPVENIAVDVGLSDTVTVSRTITPSDMNQLAVCTIGLAENFPTFESMTGATGATWVQRFHTGSSLESIGLQTANVSSGGAITGGNKTFGAAADYWSALTFCVVSAPVGMTPINTVEIGAIEWQVVTIPAASVSYTVASSTFA